MRTLHQNQNRRERRPRRSAGAAHLQIEPNHRLRRWERRGRRSLRKRRVGQFAPGCYPGVGRVTNGTFCVDFGGKPVARFVLQIFRKCEFLDSGKPSLSIDINVFFKLNLYKVYGFQWTNRKNCCIIISFQCRGLNAVIYLKR